MKMKGIFPAPSELLELEPEEIAPFLLEHLLQIDNEPTSSQLNRYNYTLSTNPELQEYAQGQIDAVTKQITEAWTWLEKEGFIAPEPNQTGGFSYITAKGKKFESHTDFNAYKSAGLLPSKNLDPVLSQKVRPLFIRGDYDTAVFQAYKEVEVRIRKSGNYGNEVLGIDLARKAFHPETGPLTDKTRVKSEQEAMMHLFSGALGSFKNPGSHRDVNFDNPSEVAEIILFANYLLRVVDSRTPDAKLQKLESEQAVPPGYTT